MGLIYAERLIEYAIRVGVDDLQNDKELVRLAFPVDKKINAGADVTPDGAEQKVFEPLPMDYFQTRLSEIPKVKGETGKQDIFANSMPGIDDVYSYLNKDDLSFKITHGFPREPGDLPAIAITLGNEDESQYLGGQKGRIGKYVIVGSDFSSQYQVHILTPNYDETIIWYFILKYCFLRYRPIMEIYGMRQIKISFLDPEPAPEYLQAGIFIYQRTCILACVKDEDIPIEEKGYTELIGKVTSQDTQTTIVPTDAEGEDPEVVGP